MRNLLKLGLSALFSFLVYGCFQTPSTSEFLSKERAQNDELAVTPANESLLLEGNAIPNRGFRYTPIVKKYSEKYGMDWVLVLAVMKQESRFNHRAVSHKGAYGLMQIMPLTGDELEGRLGVGESLTPKNNIRAGVYHLRRLSHYFRDAAPENRIKLTLASYNAGLTRIKDAQEIVRYLGDDPNSWESVRSALPLLSKRYYSLHQGIWPQGKPKSGYFGNSRETIAYVDRILENYGDFELAMK